MNHKKGERERAAANTLKGDFQDERKRARLVEQRNSA